MRRWRPCVQAVHDVHRWYEPLPQPPIELATRARIQATADICEEVPIPSGILWIWLEETRLGWPAPDVEVNRMKIAGVLR